MHARTAQIAVFTAGKDATDRKAGKRLLEQVAGDMDHYVVRMESELPLFSQYLDSTMNALVQAATLLFEFKDNDDTRDQAKEMMQNMRGFRTVLEVAEDAITTFLQEVTGVS